jgi:hypothetical protein
MPDLDLTTYHVELLCDYPEWWRYNVYVMAVGFPRAGGAGTFNNLVDKVCDANHGAVPRTRPPEGYTTPRRIALTTAPCAYIDLYLYVVANTFPATDVVGQWPPFPVTLVTTASGMPVDRLTCEVNQWGGLTLVAHRVDLLGIK